MSNEQRMQQLEKFYRKCPDVLTVLDAARWTRYVARTSSPPSSAKANSPPTPTAVKG